MAASSKSKKPVRPQTAKLPRGRPHGAKGKVGASAKEAFALAFKGMGGVVELIKWAKKNPSEFYKLYARLIPVEIGGGGPEGAIQITISGGDAKL